MLNGISRHDRVVRTLSGIKNQIEDFFWIIEEYVNNLDERDLMGLYELEEDLNKE